MATDFTRGIKVYIDSQLYGKSMKEMTAHLAKYRLELQNLINQGKQSTKEADRVRQSIQRLEKTEKQFKNEIRETQRVLNNLSGATYNQLMAAQRRLKAQLKEMVPGTKEYRLVLETLRQTQTRLTVVTNEMNVTYADQRGLFARLSSTLNKYFLVLSTIITSLTAVILAGRKAVEAFTEVEEALAKIRKYSGLTERDLHRLNRELMDVAKIDTRTSHLALLELAADAGRLGIKGVENLKAFVIAADKINLALGEDLGKDAVTNIGKLANLFGEDKRIGLENAMLSTASAVTKLAKSSTACEPYLVNFASRLGGIGSVAGITTGDILGLGSALDQNMQKVEMSSTALSTLITKLFQEPAKFARLAAIDVKDFTELVKNDANEAVLQFLSAMQRKGGFDELAPMFNDMEMSGKRAVQVLSTLASHVDQVREAQQIANAAYEENIEVQHEFDIINNTVQARLEKRRKQLQALRTELGEELMPTLLHIKTMQSYLVRGLKVMIDFFLQYKATIVSTTAAIVAYTIALKVKNNTEKISLFFTEKLTKAFKALTSAIKANPLGLLVSAVTLLIGLMADGVRKAREFRDGLASIEEISRSAAKSVQEESSHLKALLSIIADETKEEKERLQALSDLRSINEEYLGTLDSQRLSYDEASAAVQRYIESLKLQAQLESALSARKELGEIFDEMAEKADSTGFLRKAWLYSKNFIYNMFASASSGPWFMDEVRHLVDEDIYGDMRLVEQRIREVDELILSTQEDLIRLRSSQSEIVSSQVDYSEVILPSIEDIKRKYEGEGGLLEAEDEYHEQLLFQLQMQREKRLIAEEEYDVLESRLSLGHQQRLLSIYDDYYRQVKTIDMDSEEERERTLQQVHRKREKEQRGYLKSRLSIEKSFRETWEKMEKLNDKEETDPFARIEDEYARRLSLLKNYFEAIRSYILSSTDDFNTAVMLLVRLQQTYNEQLSRAAAWRDNENREEELRELKERNRTIEKYVQQTAREKYDMELEELSAYHTRGLLSEKQFQKARRDLAFSYAQEMYSSMFSYAGQMMSSLEEMEVAATERKYEILLREAENNGEDTTQLEMDQANAKLEIQKKYALSNLLVKLSQITADTAVAIMTGFAQLGPIAGAAAAAMLTATGIAQYASAYAEYDKIRSISLESTPVSTSTVDTGERVVQYASGKYDVFGADDGRTYRSVPYIGSDVTGIVERPALISERGAELIVSAPVLDRLRQRSDFSLIASAINDARLGVVRQHEKGSYSQLPTVTSSNEDNTELLSAVLSIARQIESLPREQRSYVLLSDINRSQELSLKASEPFKRKDNHTR